MKKILNKFRSLKSADKIILILWITTLILLLLFVMLAATIDKTWGTTTKKIPSHNIMNPKKPHNILDYLGKKVELSKIINNGKVIGWHFADYIFLVKGTKYATTLAVSGLIFISFLFSSLIITVLFSHENTNKEFKKYD